jgi:sulfotransferase 6B1
MFFQNAALRIVLKAGYRAYARACVFSRLPRVFINSIPKSGTHLLTAALDVTPGIQNSGIHILTWQVNQGARGPGDNESFRFDQSSFSRVLERVNRGQYLSAHLRWEQEILRCLRSLDYRIIFVIRDPRDVVVSELHYIKGLRRHYLHPFLVNAFQSDDERLSALLNGVDGRAEWASYRIAAAAERYRRFYGWLVSSSVYALRFEELVGLRGGGAREAQLDTLRSLYQHIGLTINDERVSQVAGRLASKGSFTLRKGVIGGWRSLSPHWVESIDGALADVAFEYGYE